MPLRLIACLLKPVFGARCCAVRLRHECACVAPLQAAQGAWTVAELRTALGQLEAAVAPEHISPHFRRGAPLQGKGALLGAGAALSPSGPVQPLHPTRATLNAAGQIPMTASWP
jgi:hypothetical protein